MPPSSLIIPPIYEHNLSLISLNIRGILFFVLKTKCVPKNVNVPAITIPQFLPPRWGYVFGISHIRGLHPRLYAFCPLGILRLPTEVISCHDFLARRSRNQSSEDKARRIFHYGVHAI